MSTKIEISDFPIIPLTVSRKESMLATGSFGVRFYHINYSMASRHEIKCINKPTVPALMSGLSVSAV